MHADLDTLVIALYVSVDELFGPRTGPGRRPRLSDAELVCLAVAQVLLGFASERRWLRFARARLGHLFPYLPTALGGSDQSSGSRDKVASEPVGGYELAGSDQWVRVERRGGLRARRDAVGALRLAVRFRHAHHRDAGLDRRPRQQ